MPSVFGERDVWIVLEDRDGKTDRVLAKLTNIQAAFAAYDVYVKKFPDDRIIVKHGARIIRKSWEKD